MPTAVDLTKIDDFKRLFPDLYRAEPMLVAKTRVPASEQDADSEPVFPEPAEAAI